jgi:hypothetical protein
MATCQRTVKVFFSRNLRRSSVTSRIEKDEVYTAKSSLTGLLTAAQVSINKWEKEYFKQLQRHETQVDCVFR